jgi:chromosome segregation ATPase
MQRVYAVVKEEIVPVIDDRAEVMGITRSQWISKAIDAFLHPPGDDKITSRDSHITQERDRIISGDDTITHEVTILKSQLEKTIGEADHLRGDLRVKEGELTQLKTDAEMKWRETSQLRSEVTQAKRELENLRAKADQLQADLDRKRIEAEEARSNSESLKKDLAHFQDTVKMKDQHISFLESTVHQALEKLPRSLPPSEEEAKKKGWTWKFWKRE